MPVTVVYIYGPSGCGKTRMLERAAGKKITYEAMGTVMDGVFVAHGRNFVIVDDFYKAQAEQVLTYIQSVATLSLDFFVVLCGDEQPDDIVLHMDHVFFVGTDTTMTGAREYLESVLI